MPNLYLRRKSECVLFPSPAGRGNCLRLARPKSKHLPRAGSATLGPSCGVGTKSAKRPFFTIHQRGFTVLEILIAFTIAALSMAALTKIFAQSLDVTERAGGITQATLIAQSKLAQVGAAIPLQDGGANGEEQNGAYRWQVTVTPYEVPRIESPDAPVALAPLVLPLEMKRIEVIVRYAEPERSITLVSYRAKPVTQP
jgi:general secretion pathway protein I